MNSIRRLLQYRVSSEKADSNIASLAAYTFAAVLMISGILKVSSMQTTEIELLLLTIGVVSLSMLTVVFGQLIEIDQRLRAAADEHQGCNQRP